MLDLTIRPGDVPFDEHGLVLVQEWCDNDGIVCARSYVGEGVRWMRWQGSASFRFDDTGAVDAFVERPLDSRAVLDFFHRVVEPLALQALGDETLHASAVSLASGVVGFCGDCESGKSTIAYGLSRRGYRQLADDSLVLQFGHQGVRARELPFGVRLRPQSAAFFGVGSGATQIRATGASAAAT
ncbi:MAG: hypothetical protein AB7P22_16265, partial [Vicinamibacterales bacterium]